MAVSLVRTIILYTAIMAAIRIMGKRQLGELQPSELVITIMLGDLASVPMQEPDMPIVNGIVPIITLVFLEVLLSVIGLKSKRFRNFFSGSPSIVIHNGRIMEKEMRRLRFSVDDLLEELRNKDYVNVNDVHMAIIDTNGQVCIVPKAEKRSLTPADMGLSPPEEQIPYSLVVDGRIIGENLTKINKDEEWLRAQLKKEDCTVKNIILAFYTEAEGLQLQKKEGITR